MQSDLASYISEIEKFLLVNNVVRFTIAWLIPQLKFEQFKPPTMILAPNEEAINNFLKEYNLNWEDFLKSKEGIDILQNHVSIIATKKEWPMFSSINGRFYGHNQSDMEILKPLNSTIVKLFLSGKSVVIIVIGKVLVYDDQLLNLKKSKIDDESLKGWQLLDFCDRDENRLVCDQDRQRLFRIALKGEFDFNYDDSLQEESPKELYAKFYISRIEIYVYVTHGRDMAVIQANWLIVDKGKVPEKEIDIVRGLIKRFYSRILVPLETRFAKDIQSSLVSLHLFYVYGKKETASLIRARYANPGQISSLRIEASNSWFINYFTNKDIFIVGTSQIRLEGGLDLVRFILSLKVVTQQIPIIVNEEAEIIIHVPLSGNRIIA